jgi:hypothetical protein
MESIRAVSLAPLVRDWLADTRQPRILHVFEDACNLVNENGDVLSIVRQKIGEGPFNLVVPENVLFSKHLASESSVSIRGDELIFGELTISFAYAKTWNPQPEWEVLQKKKETILARLDELQIANDRGHSFNTNFITIQSPLSNSLTASLANADLPSARTAAKKLAGLGMGLTPSGDDFLMGAIHAAWILHPVETAGHLAKEIAETAAALTTSLSAAWLRSAGRGEAGILWHELFNSLLLNADVKLPITSILSIGETSGADAFAGFVGVLTSFKERIINQCPS